MSIECYVAIGDSYTAGAEPGVPRWADALADALPGSRYVNLAVPGATSGDVLAEQVDPAIEACPDLVTVVCGANDVILTTRPDIPAFAAHFAAILGLLRTRLPGAHLATATYPDFSGFLPMRPRSRSRVARGLAAVNETIRSFAHIHGAACLDFDAHPERGVRANFAADGFHPSAAGQRKTARAFAAGLRDHFGIDLDSKEALA
jgi:phosphatidylinositol alpha 1,6-mannosyltransferase